MFMTLMVTFSDPNHLYLFILNLSSILSLAWVELKCNHVISLFLWYYAYAVR